MNQGKPAPVPIIGGNGDDALPGGASADTGYDIAVDGAGGKVYWAQTFGDRILRANLDGTSPETLLEWPELDDPVSIALDTAGGKIYWAQLLNDEVLRANLDGSNAQSLFAWPRLDDPVALVFDSSSVGPPVLFPDPGGRLGPSQWRHRLRKYPPMRALRGS